MQYTIDLLDEEEYMDVEPKSKMVYWGTKIGVSIEGQRRVLYTKDKVFAHALFIMLQDYGYEGVTKESFSKPEQKKK